MVAVREMLNHLAGTNVVAKPEISWILDITIAYPQGKPIDLSEIVTGSRAPCETVLFYRLFPSSVVRPLEIDNSDYSLARIQTGMTSVLYLNDQLVFSYELFCRRSRESPNYCPSGCTRDGRRRKYFWRIFTRMELSWERGSIRLAKVRKFNRIHCGFSFYTSFL